jgi:serine/threonine protein kinase
MAFAMSGGDIMMAMYKVSSEHQHETRLLNICNDAKLDRIIKVLDSGQEGIVTTGGHATPVVYIAFEPADGDMRKVIKKIDTVDLAWRLDLLHQVAVGLQQLHGKGISHQDLKPSNVMICESRNEGTKIGDLGRATHDQMTAAHDGLTIAGDRRYAPPEQAYGVIAESPQDRRQGCDLYHLGCLIAFAFSSTTPNQAYLKLPVAILPPYWNNGTWGGSYDEVKHHLDAAFTEYLLEFRDTLPNSIAEEITGMVQHLCTPHYIDRGHPDARRQTGRPLGLDRFISRLQHLATDARIRAKQERQP